MEMPTSIPVVIADGQVKPARVAWPGLYPLFYYVGEMRRPVECVEFCAECIPKYLGGDDVVIAAEINWEDPALKCESCGKLIESAYAEDEAQP